MAGQGVNYCGGGRANTGRGRRREGTAGWKQELQEVDAGVRRAWQGRGWPGRGELPGGANTGRGGGRGRRREGTAAGWEQELQKVDAGVRRAWHMHVCRRGAEQSTHPSHTGVLEPAPWPTGWS
jgi:hypothetical protein